MVNIIYRFYQEGDDEQLADLFNRSFQMNGAGFIRTPKTWNWRYLQSPGFDPEMVQIAEDTDNKKIAGAVYANLIEEVQIEKRNYLVGDINDVSCHPDYTGHGIASKLMENSIKYMENRGCDLSILTADPRGIAREKIYLRMGYEDVDAEILCCQFPHPLKLIRDMPSFSFLIPAFLTLSYIPRFLNRIRIKFNPFFKNITYEIAHNKKHFEYLEAANVLLAQNYTGFPGYTKEKFIWARIKPPVKRFKPTFIMIKKGTEIIGGATLTHQNMYAFKFGIKLRIGLIHEIFLNEKIFNNKRNLHLGYIYLIDKILKAATQRNIGFMYFFAPSKHYTLRKAFKGINFFTIKAATVMIKSLKESVKIPKITRPLFVPQYVSAGIP